MIERACHIFEPGQCFFGDWYFRYRMVVRDLSASCWADGGLLVYQDQPIAGVVRNGDAATRWTMTREKLREIYDQSQPGDGA